VVLIDGTGAIVAKKGLHAKVLVEEGYDHHITDVHVEHHARTVDPLRVGGQQSEPAVEDRILGLELYGVTEPAIEQRLPRIALVQVGNIGL
jgi:hypothetical protein